MLKVAYIGNGKSTNRYHLPFALKSGRVEVKTIFARHNNSTWERLANVNYTNNLDDIYTDDEIGLSGSRNPECFSLPVC